MNYYYLLHYSCIFIFTSLVTLLTPWPTNIQCQSTKGNSQHINITAVQTANQKLLMSSLTFILFVFQRFNRFFRRICRIWRFDLVRFSVMINSLVSRLWWFIRHSIFCLGTRRFFCLARVLALHQHQTTQTEH